MKKATLQKELDCSDIDDIGNLEDSSRLVFIIVECGNLIVVNDGVKNAPEILTKRRSHTFYISLQ